jgi:hypothetical protein
MFIADIKGIVTTMLVTLPTDIPNVASNIRLFLGEDFMVFQRGEDCMRKRRVGVGNYIARYPINIQKRG